MDSQVLVLTQLRIFLYFGFQLHTSVLISTAQHSTAQHSTVQHSTAQHSTAQHSTAQYSTVPQSGISV